MPEKNEVAEPHHYDGNHEEDGRMKPRACTDIICMLVFVAFLGGMGYITNFAVQNGNPKRLTHGYNYNGSLCGVDPGFENRSLLYYCPSISVAGVPGALNLKAPVCVSACPTDDTQMIPCLQQTSVLPVATVGATGPSQTLVLSQGLREMQSYATTEVMGLYCIPDLQKLNAIATAKGIPVPSGLRASLFDSSGPIGSYATKAQQYAGSLKRCWPLLLCSLLFTVIVSYTFLFLLKCFAKPLIYLVLMFLFLFFFATAGFFLIGEQFPRPAPLGPNSTAYVVPATTAVVGQTTTLFGIAPAASGRRLADTTTVAPATNHTYFTSTTVAPSGGWAVPVMPSTMSYEEACLQAPAACEQWKQRWAQYGGRHNWEAANPFYGEHLTPAQAKWCTLVTGYIFLAAGVVFMILLCCAHSSINMAIGCVKAAVECIWAIPCMIFMPAVEVVIKVVLYAILLVFLGYLLSAGEMDNKTLLSVGGQEVNGMRRRFIYTQMEQYYIAYYVFGLFWILELANAIGSFAFSYAVVDWYYTPKGPNGRKDHHWCSIAAGYLYAVTFHLGTLAMGSFLIALCRFVRLILMFLEKQEKAEGNAVTAAIIKCLICCITCFKKIFEQINKNAYIDVAINSSNFCTAAGDSLKFMLTQAPAVTILTGACTIFSFAGTAMISSLTAFTTYMLVTTQARWTSDTSPHHVASPAFVSGVAGFGAVFVAAAFMVIFDHTADTLLYTYCWNKSKAHNTVAKYAPDCLIAETGLLKEMAGEEHAYEPLKKAPVVQAKPAAQSGGGGWFGGLFGHKETDPLVPK